MAVEHAFPEYEFSFIKGDMADVARQRLQLRVAEDGDRAGFVRAKFAGWGSSVHT